MLLNPFRFLSALPPSVVGPVPTVVATSIAPGSNGVTAIPTGWAVGDLLLAVVNNGPDAYVLAGAGWIQAPLSGGTAALTNSLRLFWKIAVSGETAPQFAGPSISRYLSAMLAIRNAAPWPISTLALSTQSSSSRTLPDLTTPSDNCLIVQAVSDGVDADEARASGWTNSFISPVELTDFGTSWNEGGALATAKASLAVAGPIGATSFTWGNTGGGDGLSVAVNPTQDTIVTPPVGSGVPLSGVNGSSTNVVPWTINFPAGTASGDMAILAIGTNALNAGVPSTPSGWTVLGSQTLASATSGFWYYRLIDGTEGSAVGGNLSAANAWGATLNVLKSGSFVAGSTPEIATGTAAASESQQCPTLSPSWGNKWAWVVSSLFARGSSTTVQLAPNSTNMYGAYTNPQTYSCITPSFGTLVNPGRWGLTIPTTVGATLATIAIRRT